MGGTFLNIGGGGGASNWNDLEGKPSTFPSDWNTTANKPAVYPTNWANVSDKPNLFDGTWASLTGKPNLFSGSYTDLSDKPSTFPSDWNTMANKPTLFDGTWSSLTGKPTLFDGTWASLTGKPEIPDVNNFMNKNNPQFTGSLSGNEKETTGNNSVSLGEQNSIKATSSIGLGSTNTILGKESYAFGKGNSIYSYYGYAFGANNILGDSTISDFERGSANIERSLAIGNSNSIGATNNNAKLAIAIGTLNSIERGENYCLGRENAFSGSAGNFNVALGYYNRISGQRDYVLGESNAVSGSNCVVYGADNTVGATSSFVTGRLNTVNNNDVTVTGVCVNDSLCGGRVWPTNASNATTGTAFVIGNGTTNAFSNACRITYAGQVIGKSGYASTGADYAEYFEWLDGNPDGEDRRGYFVALDGDKIKKAKEGDFILGIVSGHPCVIGNFDECYSKQYEMDEFGDYIYVDEDGNPCKGGTYKVNPDYDPEQKYIPREDRPEWDAIGMMGRLRVHDDGTCEVNGYCVCNDEGKATKADKGYRVLKRINDHIVEVLFSMYANY